MPYYKSFFRMPLNKGDEIEDSFQNTDSDEMWPDDDIYTPPPVLPYPQSTTHEEIKNGLEQSELPLPLPQVQNTTKPSLADELKSARERLSSPNIELDADEEHYIKSNHCFGLAISREIDKHHFTIDSKEPSNCFSNNYVSWWADDETTQNDDEIESYSFYKNDYDINYNDSIEDIIRKTMHKRRAAISDEYDDVYYNHDEKWNSKRSKTYTYNTLVDNEINIPDNQCDTYYTEENMHHTMFPPQSYYDIEPDIYPESNPYDEMQFTAQI